MANMTKFHLARTQWQSLCGKGDPNHNITFARSKVTCLKCLEISALTRKPRLAAEKPRNGNEPGARTDGPRQPQAGNTDAQKWIDNSCRV